MQIKISNLPISVLARASPLISFLFAKEAAEVFDCTLGSRAELVDPKDDSRRWV